MAETKFKICKNNSQYTPIILSSNNVSQLEFYHPNTVSWNSPLMQFESIYGRQKRQDIFDLMASITYNSPKGKVHGSYLILHGTLLMRYYDNGYKVKPIAIVCTNSSRYNEKVVVINSDYINSHPSELKDIKHAAFLLGVPPRTSRAIIMKSQVEMIMMFQEKLSFNLEDLEPERQLILSREFLQNKKNPVVIEQPKEIVAEVPKTSISIRKNTHIKREDWSQFFKDEDEEIAEEEVDEIREQVDAIIANEANRRRVEEARERIDSIVNTIRNNEAPDWGTTLIGISTSSQISSTLSSNNSTLSAEEEERINREFEELLNS